MTEQNKVHKRRIFEGKIIKLSSKDTIKVRVETKYPHPKYGKIIKHHLNYLVHSTDEALNVGDAVRIRECPPISKNKKWEIIK